jgi:uncharacterized protein (DUF4213/DUF364 family)
MRILQDLIASIDADSPVRAVRQGPFQTAVWTRYCGLATTPHDSSFHHNDIPVRDAGMLLDSQAKDLMQMAQSSSPFEAAIGMAAINSLLDNEEQLCVELNAADLLAQKGSGKRIALVGHFPFVQKLRREAKELWVIEKQPRQEDLPESEAGRLIPQADVVGITGSTFINHSLDHLLSLCSPQAYVVILGGTTPLSSILFRYGVDALSGTRVTDPDLVLRLVSEGAVFRQIRGVRRLTLMKKKTI